MSLGSVVDRRLESLSVATLADALNGRGVVSAAISPQVPIATVAGPAFTVSLPRGDNLGLHIALSEAPPGSVIVAACQEPSEHGIWGEVMSTAGMHARLGGFVTNGFVRDRLRLAEIGFPVFAGGICVRRAAKSNSGRMGVVVQLGGQNVLPGDVVCGDSDGLVVIPAQELDEVVRRAEEIEMRERDVLRGLSEGRTTLELLGLDSERNGA